MMDTENKEYIKWMLADSMRLINRSIGVFLGLIIAYWLFVA